MILAIRGNHIRTSLLKRHLLIKVRVVKGILNMFFKNTFDCSRMRKGYQSGYNPRRCRETLYVIRVTLDVTLELFKLGC